MNIPGLIKIAFSVLSLLVMITMVFGFNHIRNIQECANYRKALAFTEADIFNENHEVVDFGLVPSRKMWDETSDKDYMSLLDNQQLLNIRGADKNLYQCDKNTKKPLNIHKMSLPAQNRYIMDVAAGKRPPFNLCVKNNQNSSSIMVRVNPFIELCLSEGYHPSQDKNDLPEGEKMFELKKFEWAPPILDIKKLENLSALLMTFDKSHSSTIRTLELEGKESICEESPYIQNRNSFRYTNRNRTDHNLLFSNIGGNRINLWKFKAHIEENNLKNPGFTFLADHLSHHINYKNLYGNILWGNSPIDNYSTEEINAINTARISLERSIHDKIDNLHISPLHISEYVKLIENTMNLESDAITMLLHNNVYLALRNSIAYFAMDKYPDALFREKDSIKRKKFTLIALINSSRERWSRTMEIFKSILGFKMNIFNKDGLIHFHPDTFHENANFTAYNSLITWTRICGVERIEARIKEMGKKIESLINRIPTGKDRYYSKGWGSKVHLLTEKMDNTLLADKIRWSTSLVNQRFMVMSKSVAKYIIENEMEMTNIYLSLMYILAKEIELTNLEISTLKEYQACFSSVNPEGYNPVIPSTIANNLLNKLLVRKNLYAVYFNNIDIRDRISKNTGASVDPNAINIYDLAKGNIIESHKQDMLDIKSYISSLLTNVMPRPSIIPLYEPVFTEPVSCSEVNYREEQMFDTGYGKLAIGA